MSGRPSLPRRLDRMEQQRANRQTEAQIALLAEEFGLDPGEVRQELEQISHRIARYGPEPEDASMRRLAAEFGLDEADLRAEVAETRERLRARGVLV